MSHIVDIFCVALIIALIILPPKHDPAIRWKERNERNRK